MFKANQIEYRMNLDRDSNIIREKKQTFLVLKK
jgi:hypothetical protein